MVLSGRGNIAHLVGIAEYARGEGAAIIDIRPLKLPVRRREPGEAGTQFAHQRASLFHHAADVLQPHPPSKPVAKTTSLIVVPLTQ